MKFIELQGVNNVFYYINTMHILSFREFENGKSFIEFSFKHSINIFNISVRELNDSINN